jgi:hypothetical protein
MRNLVAGTSMLATLVSGVLLCGPASAVGADVAQSPAGQAQAAVWTPKQFRFVYQGFTTRYSCDGLRDKIRETLLRLGARKDDLHVTETPCAGLGGRPTPFPGVSVRMSVLVPASGAGAQSGGGQAAGQGAAAQGAAAQGGGAGQGANSGAAGSAEVPAHWKTVELGPRGGGPDASGDCELMEQIQQKIVPLFTTRNVELSNNNCVPHQLQPTGPRLRADVLMADPRDTNAQAAQK